MNGNEYLAKPEGKFPGALTVTQLNEFVKRVIDTTPQLSDVYVKGEISNFKNHYSTGHYYFTLKDEGGQLKSVMFRSAAVKMKFVPEDGMKVTAHGRISSFVRDGTYQLYCDAMEPDGVGTLYVAFEQLKRKLEAEGLFDPARKRPLPKIPTRVGIITSATGAAIRDMINVCGRRFPYAKLVLYPTLVQGPDAPPQLIAGMQYFNTAKNVDVIIIGRGGGSIEDLWAFNDEGVARAVAASQIPVISAVGHETDFTICDFVADRRAPTPSAAAELAVPDTAELKRKILNIVTREADVIGSMLKIRREKLTSLANTRAMTNPMNFIDDRRMTSDLLADRLQRSVESILQIKKAEMAKEAGKLSALNPLSVISRGYSAVYKDDGKLVRCVDDVTVGEKIEFKTIGGQVACTVDEIKKNIYYGE
ncbi:MAG: exodeoxyribonuclease VII large subunit [Ruminococcaceae bacterium]|nr:exodeoxyribonuclease VII large subunit [Oscillospiraceae bacterium]